MIERVIRASVENRVLVLFGALLLAIAGIVTIFVGLIVAQKGH